MIYDYLLKEEGSAGYLSDPDPKRKMIRDDYLLKEEGSAGYFGTREYRRISAEDTKKSMMKKVKSAVEDLAVRTGYAGDGDRQIQNYVLYLYKDRKKYTITGIRNVLPSIFTYMCRPAEPYRPGDIVVESFRKTDSSGEDTRIFVIPEKTVHGFRRLLHNPEDGLANETGGWDTRFWNVKLTPGSIEADAELVFMPARATGAPGIVSEDTAVFDIIEPIVFWIIDMITAREDGTTVKMPDNLRWISGSLTDDIEETVVAMKPRMTAEDIEKVLTSVMSEHGKLKEDMEHDFRLLAETLSWQPLYENTLGVSIPVRINLKSVRLGWAFTDKIKECVNAERENNGWDE